MKELNTSNHHTHQYDTDKVVLRRGGHFRVHFHVSRKLSKARHALNIEFRRGRKSSFYKGSRFESRIERTSAHDWEWKGHVEKVKGLEVETVVEIPVDAPIGEYNIIAEALDLKTGHQENFIATQSVVILFNPWNEGNILHFATTYSQSTVLFDVLEYCYSIDRGRQFLSKYNIQAEQCIC